MANLHESYLKIVLLQTQFSVIFTFVNPKKESKGTNLTTYCFNEFLHSIQVRPTTVHFPKTQTTHSSAYLWTLRRTLLEKKKALAFQAFEIFEKTRKPCIRLLITIIALNYLANNCSIAGIIELECPFTCSYHFNFKVKLSKLLRAFKYIRKLCPHLLFSKLIVILDWFKDLKFPVQLFW
jgi:hypothetical protein